LITVTERRCYNVIADPVAASRRRLAEAELCAKDGRSASPPDAASKEKAESG